MICVIDYLSFSVYFAVVFSCLILLKVLAQACFIVWHKVVSLDFLSPLWLSFSSLSFKISTSYFISYFRFFSVTAIFPLLCIHLTSNLLRVLTLYDFKTICSWIKLVVWELHHQAYKVWFAELQSNHMRLALTLPGFEGMKNWWKSVSDCDYRQMKSLLSSATHFAHFFYLYLVLKVFFKYFFSILTFFPSKRSQTPLLKSPFSQAECGFNVTKWN